MAVVNVDDAFFDGIAFLFIALSFRSLYFYSRVSRFAPRQQKRETRPSSRELLSKAHWDAAKSAACSLYLCLFRFQSEKLF